MPYRSVSVKPTDRWLVGDSSLTKPTPEWDLATHKLMEEDTGDRYLWTGTKWLRTHVAGVPITASNPYGATEFYSVGTGKITVLALSDIKFSMATPATGSIIFKQMFMQSAAGETTVTLYEDVSSVQNGTVYTPTNMDRLSAETFPGTYTQGILTPVGGTVVFQGVLLGDHQQGNFADGIRLINMKLKRNNLYYLDIHNETNQDRAIAVEFSLGTTPT